MLYGSQAMHGNTVQMVHKRTSDFQNDTQYRGVLPTLRLYQLTEKHSRFCTHLAETRYILRSRHDGCRDDNPTRPTLGVEGS